VQQRLKSVDKDSAQIDGFKKLLLLQKKKVCTKGGKTTARERIQYGL
jgi:hypothetical protein